MADTQVSHLGLYRTVMMEYEGEGLLHEQFSRQARATPDNVAIVGGDGQEMTYREVDTVTDELAKTLRLKGVVPDSVVGIFMERRLEYALCYIAILKAGKTHAGETHLGYI